MKQIWMFIWLCMSTGFVAFIASCSSKVKQDKELEFYYYPEKNVYYDVTNKNFVYSIDSARTWNAMKGDITDETPLGKREVIVSTSDSVWNDNDNHRKQFGGTLYNISNTNDSIGEATEVTERKVVKKGKERTSKKASVEKEKKQPVKDFFKKLFGRKKKND